jgi:protein involved in polysaccharide export with SLBB domain
MLHICYSDHTYMENGLSLQMVSNQNIRSIKYIFRFVLLLFVSFSCTPLFSQTADEFSRIRAEELTDEQVRRFILEAERLGLNDEQTEMQVLRGGMNPDEVAKLKARIAAVRKSVYATGQVSQSHRLKSGGQARDSINALERAPVTDFSSAFAELKSRHFGSEVFNNPRSSFEPNLRLPTPANYVLAADDELLIDVSGYSEASYKLKVTPEGVIRIPSAGVVYVVGLTIEQARKNIIARLSSTIYTGIKSGKTKVDVNLGGIRSIKVTVIGEAMLPGTYTLPSVATVYNALYACSGIGDNGSYRNIQLIRNSKTVAVVDVYEYLVNGNKQGDIRLMDNDIIKINTYKVRIEVKGEVKKPGIYDVADKETLDKIIEYAGGFTENAYKNRIQLYSNTDRDRQITTLKEDQAKTMFPKAGDTYIVGKILNRFTNRLAIKGAVFRPGEYELKAGMTVLQLIEEADGLREDAFLSRGVIHRLKDDLSPEIISFDLEQLKNGKAADIVLKKEDRITIYSRFDLKEGHYVTISGEVSSPGIFLYEEGLTINDLVLMAGGLKESASLRRIEVSRRVKAVDTSANGDIKTAIIFQRDIKADLRDSSSASFQPLAPFDEVTIYAVPGYSVQKNVVIEGEIKFAGKYSLENKNERISDLVKRAGGITKEAYLKGAVLVRTRNLTKTEQNNSDQGLVNLLKQNYSSGAPSPYLQFTYEEYLRKKSDNVGINLEVILENPSSQYDLLLNDGDTLRIPSQLQTVRVSGEVLYPALVRFNKNYRFKDYIQGAGGFNERSARKKSYVVNANGSAEGTKSFFFIKNYPEIKPGSEIFVPIRRERARISVLEGVTLGTTLVTLVAILLNVTKK